MAVIKGYPAFLNLFFQLMEIDHNHSVPVLLAD
jgi:hypothetical protein